MLWLVIGVVAVAAFGAALLIDGHRRRAALAPEVRRAIASAQAARKELRRIQLAHRKNASQATKRLELEQDPRGADLRVEAVSCSMNATSRLRRDLDHWWE